MARLAHDQPCDGVEPCGSVLVLAHGARALEGLKRVSACAAEGAGGSAVPRA